MRKRRGPSFVTKTACTECRKGRAKCDGQTPCARCTSRGGLKCEYEVPVYVRKEDMRQELNELRKYRQVSEKILDLLRSREQTGTIINKLQQYEPLENIVEQQGGYSPGAESTQHGSSYSRRESAQAEGGNTMEPDDHAIADDMFQDPDEANTQSFKRGSRWTEVPLTDTVIEHLLLLYFCWEYPIFSTLSKHHFARDFNSGLGDYCSPLLVNSILAVGCRFSDQAAAMTDPDDADTAGVHCYLEAERLLSFSHGERSVTVVQSMCLMSTWNASRGDYKKARYYSGQAIRMAVEMGLHQDSDDAYLPNSIREVRGVTFWGAFMLDQAWCLATGCLPHISQGGVLAKDPTAFENDELREWIPYAGDQIPQGLDLRQPGNLQAGYRSLCELSTILHKMLYLIHADIDSMSSRDILHQYTRMLDWYSSLSEALRLGDNSTPFILFVHMYYHFSIILIFYPLIDFQFPDSNISVLEVCTDAAGAVTTLVRSYESLHGLRRTPCFLPYIIFASGIAHLRGTNPQTNPIDTLTQSAQEVAILQFTSIYHGSSKRACRVLLSRAIYPSTSGSQEDDANSSGQPLWQPFERTMALPGTDSRGTPGTAIEGFAQIRVSDGTPPYPELLHWDWFEE